MYSLFISIIVFFILFYLWIQYLLWSKKTKECSIKCKLCSSGNCGECGICNKDTVFLLGLTASDSMINLIKDLYLSMQFLLAKYFNILLPKNSIDTL